MNSVVLILGILILIAGWIGFLIAAFRTHILWGLSVLFLPIVWFFYLIVHWQDAKNSVGVQFVGVLLIPVSFFIPSGVDKQSINYRYQSNNIYYEYSHTPEPTKSWLPSFDELKTQFYSLKNQAIYFWHDQVKNVSNYVSDSPSNNSANHPAHYQSAKPYSKKFTCDGRQHCGQMRSRAEAEFFINNCPNTKMDGDFDGIPCENDSRF